MRLFGTRLDSFGSRNLPPPHENVINLIPKGIMHYLVDFIDIKEIGKSWRTTGTWEEWVDNHPEFLRLLFGGRANAQQVEEFAADMSEGNKTRADLRKLAALLGIPEAKRTRDALIDAGIVRCDVLDGLSEQEWSLLASDRGVRAVARGFIDAGDIRHLHSMLAHHLSQARNAVREGRITPEYYNHAVCLKAERMIHAGADVDAVYLSGKTPLHLAEVAPLVQLLLASGAKVQVKDKKGRTPLHESKDADCTLALVNAGAAVNAEDIDGNRPLHRATSREQTAVLLKAGATVRVFNAKGRTPLHEAVKPDQAALLRKAGADPAVADKAGNLPLNWDRLEKTGWKALWSGGSGT